MHLGKSVWGEDGGGGLQSEVLGMVRDACCLWLSDYRVDGLRFDSANDLPREAIHHLTW